jgi:hypothetical protein
LREELGQRKVEKRVLRKKFGSKRTRYQGSGEDYILSSFVICTVHYILIG